MGCWVWRSDEKIDIWALTTAISQLVERHGAMRVEPVEPLNHMSFMWNAAVMWGMYLPWLEKCILPIRLIARYINSCLWQAWPSVATRSAEKIYGCRDIYYDSVPLEVIKIRKGQSQFESELKQNVNNINPPFAVTVYHLECHLIDVWVSAAPDDPSRFAIRRNPFPAEDDKVGLIYVNTYWGVWGPLVPPKSSKWVSPPYKFPALYFVPMNTGTKLWLRLDKPDEMRVIFTKSQRRNAKAFHFVAVRAAPRRCNDWKPEWNGDKINISFMSVTMFHCFSDGNSVLPLAHDLFALYDAARLGEPCTLPPVSEPFAFQVLEQRVEDALLNRKTPGRASLRGGVYYYFGLGYCHWFGLERDIIGLLIRVAEHHRISLEIVLLGLVVCGIAHADDSPQVDMTLYAPMRDGAAEPTMIGLFSDWRDVIFSVDKDLSSILSVLLHIDYTIQHRKWTPFHALRKPERSIVNIQPVDAEERSHFSLLGENL